MNHEYLTMTVAVVTFICVISISLQGHSNVSGLLLRGLETIL